MFLGPSRPRSVRHTVTHGTLTLLRGVDKHNGAGAVPIAGGGAALLLLPSVDHCHEHQCNRGGSRRRGCCIARRRRVVGCLTLIYLGRSNTATPTTGMITTTTTTATTAAAAAAFVSTAAPKEALAEGNNRPLAAHGGQPGANVDEDDSKEQQYCSRR